MTPKEIALCAGFALALPAGQIMFKWAALFDKQLTAALPWRLLQNLPLLGAFAWYGLTALLWFYILTRVPLSQAYAFSMLGSGLVPLFAWLLFKEQMSWHVAAGFMLMLGGLWLTQQGRA